MLTQFDERSQSLLCALGSLAGYSCQASLRTAAIQNGEHENSAFDIVKTVDGKQYFFGDPLNRELAESEYLYGVFLLQALMRQGARSCLIFLIFSSMFLMLLAVKILEFSEYLRSISHIIVLLSI